MKHLFLTTITAMVLVISFSSCETENDLQETDAIENNSNTEKLSATAIIDHAKNTRLTTLWMRNDHEPWNRGNAEVYAHIIGLSSNKQPIISTVRMPYANHDKEMYYPDQKMIDWGNNYAEGVVSIVFIEADDTFPGFTQPIFITTYQPNRFLNTPVAQAVRIITDDFLREGYFAFGNRTIYSPEDDIMDVFYNISRTRDYEVPGGAVGGSRNNIYVTLKRRF